MGEIVGVHGVRGMVVVHSFTRPRDNLLQYRDWQLDERRPVTVLNSGYAGKRMVAQLAEDGAAITDRDVAAAMVGSTIAVARDALPRDDDGYYWADLVGLAVETGDGTALGTVRNLMETGANDVLIVDGERERLIPFVLDTVVTSIDLAEGRLTVDWDPDF